MTKYLTRQSPGIRIRSHTQCGRSNHYSYEEYYHETNPKIGGAPYKLDVGADLNNLLAIAKELIRTPDAPFDENRANRGLCEAIHGIVDRIAQSVKLETEAEAVVKPGGTFVPDEPHRIKAYRAILDRFGINPKNDYFASASPAVYLAGKKELHRFCVVVTHVNLADFGIPGTQPYTNADHDTMEAARRCAIRGFPEDGFPESPVVIIDLDTGEEWKPNFTTIQWRAARKD